MELETAWHIKAGGCWEKYRFSTDSANVRPRPDCIPFTPFLSSLSHTWEARGWATPDAIRFSRRRENRMVALRLQPLGDDHQMTGLPFVVATYHLPCAFFLPMVLSIHAATMC